MICSVGRCHCNRVEQERQPYAEGQVVKLVVRYSAAARTARVESLMSDYEAVFGLYNFAFFYAKAWLHMAWLECYCSNCQHCDLEEEPHSFLEMVVNDPEYTPENRATMIAWVSSDDFCLVTRALKGYLAAEKRVVWPE
jgi:hypothetical protein